MEQITKEQIQEAFDQIERLAGSLEQRYGQKLLGDSSGAAADSRAHGGRIVPFQPNSSAKYTNRNIVRPGAMIRVGQAFSNAAPTVVVECVSRVFRALLGLEGGQVFGRVNVPVGANPMFAPRPVDGPADVFEVVESSFRKARRAILKSTRERCGKVTVSTGILGTSAYAGASYLAHRLNTSSVAKGYMPCWGELFGFDLSFDERLNCELTIEGSSFPMDNESILSGQSLLAGGRYQEPGHCFAQAGHVERRRTGLIGATRGMFIVKGDVVDVRDYTTWGVMVPGVQKYGLVIILSTVIKGSDVNSFFDVRFEPVSGRREFEDLFIEALWGLRPGYRAMSSSPGFEVGILLARGDSISVL